ncbi:MAG: ferredoxin [Candidatus Moranbacteria bacterium]|nr:ferredoxin [Candidatus Moranbacteria bacterium]
MRVFVDKTKCIGCGACASLAPTVFKISLEDGKSEADQDACTRDQCEDICREAARACPAGAITIED